MPETIRPLFGLEFEVSFSALDASMQRVSPGRVLRKFMDVAGKRLVHLPGRDSNGIFLGNGARLYLDCGKPEITTPEVTTPTDACRYTRAGEEILLEVCAALIDEDPLVTQIILSRCNVSYGWNANAWACHESYSHRGDQNIASGFVPHAVSRIVYTGAGGFDNRSLGTEFLISPRVACLKKTISENTQSERGIFNTKDEPLNSAGYHRLHVICGENVSSIRAQWLKMATTAVVVAMVQAGLSPGAGLQLVNPVRAMRNIARDPTLTANVLTNQGRRLTAIDMQRQLLDKAKRLRVPGPINDWLPDCLRLWEETLDRLQQGVGAVQRSLDWAVKLELFQNYATGRGLPWERLEQWNKPFTRLARCVDERTHYQELPSASRLAWLRSMRGKLDSESELDWGELELVVALRQELFELDARFGQLGSQGIFNSLDAEGWLDHQVPGVDGVRQAMVEPPSTGRARLRGRVIQELARQDTPGACEWNGVWDLRKPRVLDLEDPFASEEKWRTLSGLEPRSTGNAPMMERALAYAISRYDRGEYETAHRFMRASRTWLDVGTDDPAHDSDRFLAWIQARRGYIDGAECLDPIYRGQPVSLDMISDYVQVHRFQGLRPGHEYHTWCQLGLDQLDNTLGANLRFVAMIRSTHAFDLLCFSRPFEAWDAFHDSLRRELIDELHPRVHARFLTEKADVARWLGRFEEALALLDEAHEIQMRENYKGDIADLTLTQRAKVMARKGDFEDAWELLAIALRTQRDDANVVGEARTRMLMERIRSRAVVDGDEHAPRESHERILAICRDRPALASCPLAYRIREQWRLWCAGRTLPGETDSFWGL